MSVNDASDNHLTYCMNCLAMSTRPRISFDARGWCNACVWMERKVALDWEPRKMKLAKLLDKHRGDGFRFDCIVPVSGGKDGSYVAHNLQNVHGMNPLCVTVTPPLALDLGERNLRNFVASGFNHISVNPHPVAMQRLNTIGFKDMGFPYYGWLLAIHSTIIRVAINFGVGLIFYGEDGEVEYGGTQATMEEPIYDVQYMKDVYLEGGYEKVLIKAEIPESTLSLFRFPDSYELAEVKLDITHWSYFENWDPYRNYLVAKEFCGLEEAEETNAGTFTNFSQNDQALYALHTYMMYLKFGFGRANQDACIEVRRGAMDRDQAVNLVRLYDGHFPEEFLDEYLNYYEMDRGEFDAVLDRWVNRELFAKVDGYWRPNFEVR